jgi:hypothetical protein
MAAQDNVRMWLYVLGTGATHTHSEHAHAASTEAHGKSTEAHGKSAAHKK